MKKYIVASLILTIAITFMVIAADEQPEVQVQYRYHDTYYDNGIQVGGGITVLGATDEDADRRIVITRVNVRQSDGTWRSLETKRVSFNKNLHGVWIFDEMWILPWFIALLFIHGLI